MYKIPENFTIPPEAKRFEEDCDALGVISDIENWYVTVDWVEKFKKHADILESLAEKGDPWAQYRLGRIYFCGYLYSSAEEHQNNYEKDAKIGSHWLEKCAKQGFVAAVDNLVGSGVGEESDRLRIITKQVENDHPEYIQKWEHNKNFPVILPILFETVWKIAYAGTCMK